jgi:hypothetical protein
MNNNEIENGAKVLLVAGLTMEQWIAKETTKRQTTWWGESCEIEPVICSTVFGDGLQLAYLGTIDQRPNYWLIRIDSKTDLNADDFNFETLLEPLENEFGRHPDFVIDKYEFDKLKKANNSKVEDYENFEEYNISCAYPSVWWGGGHWGTVVNFGTGEIG